MVTYLEDARTDARISQAALAAEADVHRATIVSIEAGRRPKEVTATTVAEALKRLGGGELDPAYLHHHRLSLDPIAGESINHVGRLLGYLPMEQPEHETWGVLGELIQASPDYLHGKLYHLRDQCLGPHLERLDPEMGLPGLMRYPLLFMGPTEERAQALANSDELFRNSSIARVYLSDLYESSWRVWSRFCSRLPW